MLGNINCRSAQTCDVPRVDDRYSRNPKDDLKEAIDLLWKFKEALDKLHPDCLMFMDRMLSSGNRPY